MEGFQISMGKRKYFFWKLENHEPWKKFTSPGLYTGNILQSEQTNE
jgi:hypothetical protein